MEAVFNRPSRVLRAVSEMSRAATSKPSLPRSIEWRPAPQPTSRTHFAPLRFKLFAYSTTSASGGEASSHLPSLHASSHGCALDIIAHDVFNLRTIFLTREEKSSYFEGFFVYSSNNVYSSSTFG